jgi:hypothetical protein
MVCLPDQLPLLKFGNQDAVSYEAHWLADEITKAALKAGHDDWFFAGDITRAVIEYLRHRHPRNTITIEELYLKIEHILEYLGCDDIARTLEIAPPPMKIALHDIAREAGSGYESGFFKILGERLEHSEGAGVGQILCEGLRGAVKRLCRVTRWTPECELLADQIAEFLSCELLRHRGEGNIDLILR